MTVTRASLALALALLVACSGSDDDSSRSDRSAPLESLSEVPLLGVLIADCREDRSPDSASVVDVADLGLIHLPPLTAVSGTDLGDFLLSLDLHGEELPVVNTLLALEDPSLFLPLPIDDLLDLLSDDGIPLDTAVLGATSLGCEDEGAPALGLIPVLSALPS